MSQEEEKNPVLEYAAQRYAPDTTPVNTLETEIVTENTTEASSEPPSETEIVVTQPSAEIVTDVPTTEPAPVVIPEVDYSKFLLENTDGLFTDIESLKSNLPKFKEYDGLLAAKTQLEEKVKTMFTPANDYVKTVNDMLLAGKTSEEIENFTKISRLDIDQLSATEAKVLVMVKNGYSEAIARQKIERDFPIEDYEEGSKDRAILEEELRVSSLEDKRILKEYKKEISTIDNSEAEKAKELAETQRLQIIAQTEQHTNYVKQIAPKIAQTIGGLGEKNLNGKEGDEAIKLNFDFNDEFKAELSVKLENFFLDGEMPVNDENIQLASKYLKADYLERNFDTIAQNIFKHATALAEERMINKYENRTGLPAESTNVVIDDSKKEYNDFLNKIAKRG